MFCPNCGKSDQQPAGYCRQCGTLQPDLSQPYHFPHLSRSAVRLNTVANAVAAVISLASALVLYAVVLGIGGGVIVHLIAWASILIGLWCAFASWKSYQLEQDFSSGMIGDLLGNLADVPSVTDKLLNQPNFEDAVPPSVTDSTTRQLADVRNRSTKS